MFRDLTRNKQDFLTYITVYVMLKDKLDLSILKEKLEESTEVYFENPLVENSSFMTTLYELKAISEVLTKYNNSGLKLHSTFFTQFEEIMTKMPSLAKYKKYLDTIKQYSQV